MLMSQMEMDAVQLALQKVDILVFRHLINILNQPVLSHARVQVVQLYLFVEMDLEISSNSVMMEIKYNLMVAQIAQQMVATIANILLEDLQIFVFNAQIIVQNVEINVHCVMLDLCYIRINVFHNVHKTIINKVTLVNLVLQDAKIVKVRYV